jgi:chemotaxis protein methyltransferase CheR
MTLLDQFPPGSGWEIEITATDLSTRTLEIARQAVFPLALAGEIPGAYLKAFMLKGIREQADKMKAGPDLRSVVRFFRLNLNDASYPFQGHFDLIFCRNVLIYFDRHSRSRVTGRLLEHLSPQGYLFVGHAESLHEMGGRIRSVIPTVYTPAPGAGAERNATA